MKKIILSLMMLCSMTAAWAEDDGFIEVDTTEKLWNAIKKDARAKVRLIADFALSDINKDYELYRETFSGTIDGNGHTIKGDPKADVRARTYMFYWSDGATFKNLTFKGIRVNSQSNPNQAIITAKAKNGCVFENITFDNVHTFSDYDNAGGVAGWAQDCTFTNITVKNSDFTTDATQSGAVVAHAINCTFTNIKVENCESTSDDGKSGGVAGRTDGGTINNVEILGTFIKTNSEYGGGVVGYAENTQFTNCVVDDQSCVCVDGAGNDAYAGGIVGYDQNGSFKNCINSALIAGDAGWIGGIAGDVPGTSSFEDCLNTGMVISMGMNVVKDGFYNKYKTKSDLTCVTKTYKGKEYVIRKYKADASDKFLGGIIGESYQCTIDRCANLGSVYSTNYEYAGGIAGRISQGKVSNCLCDFHGDSNINAFFGIIGKTGTGESTINNCLNMTTYIDFPADPADADNWIAFYGGNNYSLAKEGNISDVTETTAEIVKSGKICALLGDVWQQNIGIDAYPTPTGNGGLIFADNLDPEKYTYTQTQSNVTIKRTFDTDGWYSLCLPFSLTTEETAAKFAQVAEFRELDGDTYKFTTVNDIVAGLPYIVRVDTKLENPMFEEVTIGANLDLGPDQSGAFVGVLRPTVLGDGCKVIGSGTTVNPVTPGTMKAFRCYFKPSQAGAKTMFFSVDDGVATAIESSEFDALPSPDDHRLSSYNLSGQKVDDSYRGIVVKNGKKYMNK